MKKIISIISLVTMCIVMQGQTIKPAEQYFDFNDQNNIYFKDVNNHYNKFLGEWEATDGLHYVKIKITKVPKVEQGISSNGRRMMKIRRFIDEIVIECLYKYNGIDIYNTMSNSSNVSNFCVGQILNNPNKLELIYLEPHIGCGRNRTGWLILNYLSNSNQQLQWIRTEKLSQALETLCPENQVDTSPYKIPSNLTFTKL
jgi:hypothetical protein